MRVTVRQEQESSSYPYQNGEVVKATLDSVVPKTLTWTDKQTGAPKTANRWEWTFVTDTGVMASGLTPSFITKGNQTRAWCEAMVGPLPDGFEFDTDSLLGLTCLVKLRQRKPFTSKRTGKTYYPMNVEEVMGDDSATNVF